MRPPCSSKARTSKKTGARGLRSILEDILTDTMFELPNDDLERVIIDENAVHRKDPIKVYKSSKKTSVGK